MAAAATMAEAAAATAAAAAAANMQINNVVGENACQTIKPKNLIGGRAATVAVAVAAAALYTTIV